MLKKFKTVCFTGHRNIPPDERKLIVKKLEQTIKKLIEMGYVYFGTGGALGFDTIAAQTVLKLKMKYPHIRLILVLPCETQADKWSDEDKTIYYDIKSKADKSICISQNYTNECLFKRNRHLVDNSNLCLCYYKHNKGGTAYTVHYAISKQKLVINIADEIPNDLDSNYLNISMYPNYTFVRDYRDNKSEESVSDKKMRIEGIKTLCGDGLIDTSNPLYRIPKAIIPNDAITFERLLPKLDKFTELGKGTIRAVIDYYMWESYFEIYLKHLEFFTEEDFLLLQDISRNTNSFTVYSTEDGGVRLWILIHYFDDIYELDEEVF